MTRSSLMMMALVSSMSASCGMGPDSAAPARIATAGDERPALGSIVTRDRRVTFRGSEEGPRFTVETLDGRVLAEGLSYDQLAARHPELHDMLRGFAVEKSAAPRTLDARVGPVLYAY